LIQGYALNQKRFEENAAELKQALALIQKAAKSPALATDMGRGLVDIMGRYTTTFLWLQQYDVGLLKEPGGFPGGILSTPKAAMASILALKQQYVEIKKTEKEFSPTTMYADYPVNRSLLHWESSILALDFLFFE